MNATASYRVNAAKSFSFIDLFSGIGGFHLALKELGGTCLGYSEVDADAIYYYCHNHKESLQSNFGDIRNATQLPHCDILTAGVPCQSWSIAGRNLGFADDRGQLWNDTLYLLQTSQPKAFIFENVKGLADPRNAKALAYIMQRIADAGYYAKYYVIDSQDYSVPQSRVRIYILGFKNEKCKKIFKLPEVLNKKEKLLNIFPTISPNYNEDNKLNNNIESLDLLGDIQVQKSWSLSSTNGLNDYFLFNDLRNGHSTIHSWDIIKATERQKYICLLLLKNRRKKQYGLLDGNPLSLQDFQSLDATITSDEIKELVDLNIFSPENYIFRKTSYINNNLVIGEISSEEQDVLSVLKEDVFVSDFVKSHADIKSKKIKVGEILKKLIEKNILVCEEVKYDFKNTKISTGLFGINRIFLPHAKIFPTLVASDTHDYIATKSIFAKNEIDFKKKFMEEIYFAGNYRKINKEEACVIQGFPPDFCLPDNRARWMKLIGNSVSVPVIKKLAEAMLQTGFLEEKWESEITDSNFSSSTFGK
jgi:DNA (cytosine-5)-methyltransferase 1